MGSYISTLGTGLYQSYTATVTQATLLYQRYTARPVARFRRPDYLKWLKAGMALKCCGEGLVDFCTDVITTFHTTLITQHGPAVCSSPLNPKKMTYDRGSKSWRVNCACGVCDTWLQSIASELATNQYSWKNTDVNEWPLHPWQLAKVFMGDGKDPTNHDPADTDTAGFLQLIINCQLFANRLVEAKVKSVREVRNDILHSPNFEVTSADLTTYLDKMTDLLQEPALQQYASARRAVDEINKIDATSLDVNVAAVRDHESIMYKQMVVEQTTNLKVFRRYKQTLIVIYQ
ncbi:hypothetical protein NP493_661g01000 [Ridgeia piscesae]|uniref:Uncharacterized protein n=1 Tax=Ridgeia piscesae TaxID=27915 RepID=A0AAD9KRP7_RIDPI|nr:hypothetical protein NP493_661g01000 [Ridgeia piscesae]